MPTLVFHNDGPLDIETAFTFGVSVKENDSPIGQFGTGLKYAIAIVLRLGGHVTIYTGGKTYAFSTREHTLRNDAVAHIVYMNDERAGFSTDYGKFGSRGWPSVSFTATHLTKAEIVP